MLVFHVSFLREGKTSEDVSSNVTPQWLGRVSILRLMCEILPSQLHQLMSCIPIWIQLSRAICAVSSPSYLIYAESKIGGDCNEGCRDWGGYRLFWSRWGNGTKNRKMISEAWCFGSFIDICLVHLYSFQIYWYLAQDLGILYLDTWSGLCYRTLRLQSQLHGHQHGLFNASQTRRNENHVCL